MSTHETRHRQQRRSLGCLTQAVSRACQVWMIAGWLAATSLALPAADSAPASRPAVRWTALAALPNLTDGVWGSGGPGSGLPPGTVKSIPPLNAAALARNQAATHPQDPSDAGAAGDSCLPLGLPTVMLRPYPFEFMYAPGRITMLLELDGQIRRIYTDGRSHPEDPDLTYGGHSVGHWEKGTLVVDTVGILPDVTLVPGVSLGESAHIVERMHLTAPDTLTIDTTIDAPGALTAPWHYSLSYQRHRNWQVQEYFCAQNPRTSTDEQGRAVLDLTPPK